MRTPIEPSDMERHQLNANSKGQLGDILAIHGYGLIHGVLSRDDCSFWTQLVTTRLNESDNGPLRSFGVRDSKPLTYGSRNVLELIPEVEQLVASPIIWQFCKEILGPSFGIVRVLYFDKPPGASWSLSWHQDLTVAVKNHQPLEPGTHQGNVDPQTAFSKPTKKGGVCHVEAPQKVLESMLTLRFHLDPMTETNGPLYVRPGSHRHGKLLHTELTSVSEDGKAVYCEAGDCMYMRPLISHASIGCKPENTLHRRIIHIELGASICQIAPFEWHSFAPVSLHSLEGVCLNKSPR